MWDPEKWADTESYHIALNSKAGWLTNKKYMFIWVKTYLWALKRNGWPLLEEAAIIYFVSLFCSFFVFQINMDLKTVQDILEAALVKKSDKYVQVKFLTDKHIIGIWWNIWIIMNFRNRLDVSLMS